VDHTSTIQQEITMTTKIKVSVTSDIFSSNQVMNFSRVAKTDYPLGGANWVTEGLSRIESIQVVLRFVYDLVLHNLREDKFWLLIGSSTWQPDNRLIRHKRLWGALKARGIEVPEGSDKKEVTLESDGRVKFFGAVQLSEALLECAAKAIVDERCAYLIALSEHSAINDLLNVGWSGDFRDDDYVRAYAAEHEVLVFKRVGEFDDRETGLAAIGKPSRLKKITS
jgi:hypothetical protein